LPELAKTITNLGHAAARAGRRLRRDGVSGLFRKLADWRRYRTMQGEIDQRYGIDTQAKVGIEELSASGPNVGYAYDYLPSPALWFDRIVGQLPIEFRDYVFVDLGSGKGLAVMRAARFGFRRVIGVEFGENLYQVARSNVAKLQEQEKATGVIELVLGDAAEFQFPNDALVLYLYNPFGPEVVRKVVANLEVSLSERPRNCWLVYVNPLHHEIFAKCGFLQIHTENLGRDSGEPFVIYTAVRSGE
jgi:16S rRNA G966 N2-methylase RsmD